MNNSVFMAIVILLLPFSNINAADAMLNVASQFNVKTTADRLEKILKEKGMIIFNRIQHSDSAEKVGIQLNDTELLIFGNPKAGSPLMKCQQTIAIDLPQKALVWKDGNNKVWISYNDIRYLEKRHHVKNCEKVISKVESMLAIITASAANK